MKSLLTGLIAGCLASTLSGASLAGDQVPIRSHFDQNRSHFSQNQSHFSQHSSPFRQNDAYGERGWRHGSPPGFEGRPGFSDRPGFEARPGYGRPPGFDRPGDSFPPIHGGQWGYDGRPGFGWHRPERIDPDERLRRHYERLYDAQRRQFEREERETIDGTAPRGNGDYGPDRWQRPGYRLPDDRLPRGYRPPSAGYPLPPHGYPLPGQSRPPAFGTPDRGVDLYADPRGPAPETLYSR